MDIFDRYVQLVKSAGVLGTTARILAGPDLKGRLIRFRDSIPGRWDTIRDFGYSHIAQQVNPFDSRLQDTMSFSLGRGLADFFLPKVYDADDLGPYEEYSAFLKETEKGDMLLREAAKLRRRARLIKLQREREEKGKEDAATKRYF